MSLQIERLSVQIDDKTILNDISLDLPQGKLIGILGPNGAGKSTLLRCLAGVQDYTGNISLNQGDVRASQKEQTKQLAYLPQTQTCHWPVLVERFVALGRYPHNQLRQFSDQDLHAVERALQQTDVNHLIGRPMNTLSGGEKARVLLARALCTESNILLADEPIVSLDPKHQLDVMDLLQRITLENKTVVVVLHELTLAARFCDHLILLKDGHLHAEGSAKTVLNEQNLKTVYDIYAVFGEHQNEPWLQPWSSIKKEG